MISCPQGDVKHMGHVGLDGAYFGDIEFMSTNAPKVIEIIKQKFLSFHSKFIVILCIHS